jgi:hypothetical protein
MQVEGYGPRQQSQLELATCPFVAENGGIGKSIPKKVFPPPNPTAKSSNKEYGRRDINGWTAFIYGQGGSWVLSWWLG